MRIPSRLTAVATAASLSLALLAAPDPALAQAGDAAALDSVLTAARTALGGPALERLTALSGEGEFRRVFGQREMNGDIGFTLAGGDKFLWTETMSPTGDPTMRIVRTSGLNGTTTLESVSGGGGRFMGGPGGGPGVGPGGPGSAEDAEARRARQLRMQQRQVSRVLLSMLLKADGPLPLAFAYGGEADSDDGKADVITVTGPDSFSAQVFVDRKSHLPLVLAFRDAQPRMMGRPPQPQPGQPAPTREEMEQRMREARERARTEPPVIVDVQWFLSDHKRVGGVMLPHTIRRVENGEVREEWTFQKFTVNPTLKPDTFDKK